MAATHHKLFTGDSAMGLDMYLNRRTYVQRWDHQSERDKYLVNVKRGGHECRHIQPERVSYVIEQVMYWRKANHIHRWFVENCQDGVDDCRDWYVGVEKLQELLSLCEQVLASVETTEDQVNTGTTYYPDGRVEHHTEPGRVVAKAGLAAKLLPTAQGFFFGGTDYDEFYLRDTERTVNELKKLLAEHQAAHKDGVYSDFMYHSSW